jgi:uncharacterized protein (TIGR02118 family)
MCTEVITITVLLSKSEDQEVFDEYYFNFHVPLLHRLPNVMNVSVNRVFEVSNLETSPQYVTSFSFETKEVMKAALASARGKLVYDDVNQLMRYLDSAPQILFSESHA